MKKTVVSVLALVLVVSLSLVAFVACNDKDQPQKASNSEVLGTTVAVLASNAVGASSAAEDNADVNFNAGVNLEVGDNNELTVGSQLIAKGVGAAIKPVLQEMVDRVDNVLGENGIKVEKVESTLSDYTEKYAITITYTDEETGETKSGELALYVKLSEGAELEGKKDYTFDAKVTLVKKATEEGEKDDEIAVTSFSGKATFDTAKDAMVFALGASAGDKDTANAFANVKAYATAQGTVKIEMGAGASVVEGLGANASLSVEVGKLADGKYGAVVTAQGSADLTKFAELVGMTVPAGMNTVGAEFTATINIYANSQENAGEFALEGNIETTVKVPSIGIIEGGTYKGTAAVSGKAVYDADKDEAVVGLNGKINFVKVEENENK